MKHIQTHEDMVEGIYYLCYEKFDSNEEYICIGKMEYQQDDYDMIMRSPIMLEWDILNGLASRRSTPKDKWYLYEDGKQFDPQEIYELSEDEILAHVLMETI